MTWMDAPGSSSPTIRTMRASDARSNDSRRLRDDESSAGASITSAGGGCADALPAILMSAVIVVITATRMVTSLSEFARAGRGACANMARPCATRLALVVPPQHGGRQLRWLL